MTARNTASWSERSQAPLTPLSTLYTEVHLHTFVKLLFTWCFYQLDSASNPHVLKKSHCTCFMSKNYTTAEVEKKYLLMSLTK